MRVATVLCALLACVGAFIYRRHQKRPPFLLGRPPGGQLRSAIYHGTGGRSSLSGDDNPYPWVQTQWFTQKKDHFDPRNVDTWQQKYYFNPRYYKNTSLIFLMIGGEGPEPIKWAGNPDVSYLKWAEKYGAMVFDLEHRFFGDSWPIPNMEFDALKLCTTQQALADISNFIIAMNKKFGFNDPRWVTFGGSYPGSLSAFFRAKYPDQTVGAIASSAPINLKLDFYEYAMVVQDDVTLTDKNCPGEIQKAFDKMQMLSLTVDGRNQLNKIWNLQPPFDKDTTKLDITNFFANAYSLFQGMIQYTYDGQSQVTHTNITARALCNLMTNASVADPVQRAYNVWLWYQSFYSSPGDDITIFPNSYYDMIEYMSQKNYTMMDENGADRGWMWLCCNEIGFLQTTDQGRNIFGSTVPLNYFIDMCTDLFGAQINVNFVRDNNVRAQEFYMKAEEATNIVLPNGSLDPWHALGMSVNEASENRQVAPYLINGTAHCSDMYPVYDGEPAGLPAARLFIEQNLQAFIAPQEHTIPTPQPVATTTNMADGSTTSVPAGSVKTTSSAPGGPTPSIPTPGPGATTTIGKDSSTPTFTGSPPSSTVQPADESTKSSNFISTLTSLLVAVLLMSFFQ